MTMKMAVAMLAYDRADYAAPVLSSLQAQTIAGEPLGACFDLWLFQDGLCGDDPASDPDRHGAIARLFASQGTPGRVVTQSGNLGVAGHFDVAEKRLFREEGYDYVVFCEDDLVLAPGYMATMALLAERFAEDPRVGMVSANPGDVTVAREVQEARRGAYSAMDHNWGFGISRRFWERRQPFVEHYLALIGERPYRRRPGHLVTQWLRACGFDPLGSSQDYAKQCATMALGAVRIATGFNLGLPIGRTGLHCRPELFERMGFTRTVVARGAPASLAPLDQETYAGIFRKQARGMAQMPRIMPEGIDQETVRGWEKRVLAGETAPERVLGANWRARIDEPPAPSASSVPPAHAPLVWSAADIPRLPHMEPEGLALLRECLAGANCYLEFGAGGSTVLAAAMGLEAIISVESDPAYLEATRAAAEAEAGAGAAAAIAPHPVDIGPTAAWGNPVDPGKAARWPAYCGSVWQRIIGGELASPDLILVDGRFRVACFLLSAISAKPGTVILFDDYFDRPHYHVVESCLKPVGRAGRMARFEVPPNEEAGLQRYLPELLTHSTDYR